MIQIEQLYKTYDKHTRQANPVLKDISLTLPDTGFVCILGPSGCGKTTLMNIVGGLDTFDSGKITVGGVTAEKYGTKAMEQARNEKFGYIFQNYYLLTERSVAYNVYLGLHSLSVSHREKLRRVRDALESVGMLAYSRKTVGNLSGGQQQRVAIARALARKPQVIFADEPTGNLDSTNTNHICALLRQISATCLVVMVTHEERIARQFSDRIISLREGEIQSDRENTPEELLAEPEVVAENAQNTPMAKAAKPAELSAAEPAKAETAPETVQSLTLRAMLSQAFQLFTAKGLRTGWLVGCLFLLTAVAVLAVGDYMTTQTIRPENFIITDSHMLEVEVLRGGKSGASVSEAFTKYIDYLDASGLDITYVPTVSSPTFYSYDSFLQMNTLKEGVLGFSYVPLEKLEEDCLMYGRLPESVEEVVVDAWTLEKFLEGSGVMQASITDLSHFLGRTLTLNQKKIELTIVGICDSKEPAIYVDPFALLSIGSAGTGVMSLSQLQAIYPGQFDEITLGEKEALVGPNAGLQKVGNYFTTSSRLQYEIVEVLKEPIYAQLVVADEQYDTLLRAMIANTRHFMIYSEEKEAVKQLLTGALPDELKGIIQVEVTDHYSDYMRAYRAATAKRVSARVIVTLTILLLAAVMLMLLLKTRINERLELFAVYRLLGIARGRTVMIFAFENLYFSVLASLPAALVTWGLIKALTIMPSLSFEMVLPFGAMLLTYVLIFGFQLLSSLIPAARLLHLPPAILAGRYDF